MLASCPAAQVRGSAHSEPEKSLSWGRGGCEHRPHVSSATKRGGSTERGWGPSFNSSSSTAEPSTTGPRQTQPWSTGCIIPRTLHALECSYNKKWVFSPLMVCSKD